MRPRKIPPTTNHTMNIRSHWASEQEVRNVFIFKRPWIASMARYQSDLSFEINLQIHLNNSARFRAKKLDTPNPPYFLAERTLGQLTHEIFFSLSWTPLKKSLRRVSIRARTVFGNFLLVITKFVLYFLLHLQHRFSLSSGQMVIDPMI